MNDKYIISLDLDNTLLFEDKHISDGAIKYLRYLESLGHHVILNTGRPHQSSIKFLKMLEIDEPIIVNNGGAVIYLNRDYSKIININASSINKKLIKDLNKEIYEAIDACLLTGARGGYCKNKDGLIWWSKHETDDYKIVNTDITKIINDKIYFSEYYIKQEWMGFFLEIINKPIYKDKLSLFDWGIYSTHHSVEIVRKNTNKWTTLLKLAKTYGINKNHIIALGDNLNDLEMINKSGFGAAMKNSRDEVRLNAKRVTKYSNEEDGVLKYLEEIFGEYNENER